MRLALAVRRAAGPDRDAARAGADGAVIAEATALSLSPDVALVARFLAPPRGRLVAAVLALLCERHGTTVPMLRGLLFSPDPVTQLDGGSPGLALPCAARRGRGPGRLKPAWRGADD